MSLITTVKSLTQKAANGSCTKLSASTLKETYSTVKDACELAQKLHVPNLVLYHTEDKNIQNRKELYSAEGESYFSGNLYIPNDLESIEIV